MEGTSHCGRARSERCWSSRRHLLDCHGTSLLRAAPEHVKPAVYKDTGATDTMIPWIVPSWRFLGVRNRGVTHYTDLTEEEGRD